MAAPFSMDLRERLARVVEATGSRRAAARQFEVSASCVIKLMQRLKRTGSLVPAAMGGKKGFALAPHEALVRALVAAQRDITLDELKEQLAQHGVEVGRSSIARFLTALGLTRKKRRFMPPSRTGPMSPRRAQPGARDSRA